MEPWFPWEDGDPPDAWTKAGSLGPFGPAPGAPGARMQVLQMGLCGRWGGGDAVMGVSSSLASLWGSTARRCGGPGCETPGTRERGAAHEVSGFDMGGDPAAAPFEQQMQLDLGLTDITKFFSYSKLWRMLYFVNDAPFRIRNHGRGAGEWTPPTGRFLGLREGHCNPEFEESEDLRWIPKPPLNQSPTTQFPR